jgi:tRNA pseudouridine38-40 synthase
MPPDVAARAVRLAADDFHPRYDAWARTYHYQVYLESERDPLRDRFAWRVWPPPEIALLQKAAGLLLGEHDFRAFGNPPKPGGNTIRAVYQADWQISAGGWLFAITANAFLYHMVRRAVYLLVQAGQKRVGLGELQAAVAESRLLKPGLAPPQGLVLAAVSYQKQVGMDLDQLTMGDINPLIKSGVDDSGKDLRH